MVKRIEMDNHSIERELVECGGATIAQECACCALVYSIALPSGARIKARGSRHFLFSHDQNPPIIDARYVAPFFKMPYMEVAFSDMPPLRIRKKKGFTSRSILILNEDDMPVLKMRIARVCTRTEYAVLGDQDIEVCRIRKDWGEYDVPFPADLDVRYKAALLVACMYADFLNRRN